jgi:hypothetical protein
VRKKRLGAIAAITRAPFYLSSLTKIKTLCWIMLETI